MDLSHVNTTSFLFDDHMEKNRSHNGFKSITSPVAKSYLQSSSDDNFPTLRSNGTSGLVSITFLLVDLQH